MDDETMDAQLAFAGADAIIILCLYAAAMILIGWLCGRGKGLGRSVSEYYLAGRNLGVITLFFTLYATQYSGNTVVGYAPQAYREGFSWLQSIPFFTVIIGIYLLFAPRLYAVGKKRGFVTPTDWISQRFHSRAVTALAIVLMLWGLANYLLEQLVAIGHAVSGLTGGAIPYGWAVIAFIVVMLVYEWLGGMRAVAITDAMQGIILMVGIVIMLVGALALTGGGITDLTASIAENEPEKIGVPDTLTSINWLSMLVIVGFGAAMYPHAIQRIYSSRSERILKRSLARMTWMPFITSGLVFVVGIICIDLYPGLDVSASEELVGMLANDVASLNPFFYWTMVILFGAVVGAIVSTADSVLLSFSSMISHDIYGKLIRPAASDRQKVLVGKITGIVLIALLLWIAWNPPGTLYQIFVLKFEILVQVAPAFVLGLYWRRLSSTAVFWGMLVGAAVAAVMTLSGHSTFLGVHGGTYGLLLNFGICVVGSWLRPPSAESQRATATLTESATPPARG
ncbi:MULTISPECIES: sodium:solute symporter family protein [Nesterenkonia]|uniref:SSS family solute:Na+ symporter/sodium/pantothenate symporter n=1 Tax=Nesterenkonia xinjiangensis TaxID=225327 RepID=A0A7Z0K7H1_9MICC|nr:MULTISPECIES: sodium:solute symporter family protein [Nesterenkonia]MDZ5078568.1 sodium:solute symporter family protein [Nesterenkonia sp. HG001]NYJ76596.1 SSS family solute:Na+ symporter/sodium/pantothenate symporter [Nesterenkonia xinjiangensis]